MKIFFYSLRDFDELGYAKEYSEQYGIDFGWTGDYPSAENVSLAAGADAVSMTPCDMSAPMLEAFAAVGVKYILCRSIGYDHVDLARAKELGMRVSNVSYPPDGVADYAIMLMMMCCRRIPQILARAAVQDFTLKGKIGRDISGLTVGVIGTGRIGTTVVRHLSGFGCRILASDLYPNDTVRGLAEYVSNEELFAQADIITLHTNATAQNHHLLGTQAFSQMKDGVIIVNTSRGKLIDTDALVRALESGKVGAAALDVLEREDGLYYYNRVGDVIVNPDMAILRSFPNVILSPHTAFYTEVNVRHMVDGCFAACADFAAGRESVHEVGLR